jgi:hypothetical protein
MIAVMITECKNSGLNFLSETSMITPEITVKIRKINPKTANQ